MACQHEVLKSKLAVNKMGTRLLNLHVIVTTTMQYMPIFFCLGTTLQNKLQRLQNRAVRIITKRGYG